MSDRDDDEETTPPDDWTSATAAALGEELRRRVAAGVAAAAAYAAVDPGGAVSAGLAILSAGITAAEGRWRGDPAVGALREGFVRIEAEGASLARRRGGRGAPSGRGGEGPKGAL